MNQAQINAGGPEGYSHLCEVLQSFYFVSLVPMDENRGEEGRGLREEWADTDNGDLYDLEKNMVPYSCTMMELIVVMARRMHFEMLDSQFEAGIGKWSREILENAARYVKPGGRLLFSTCTVDPLENEENREWFLEGHPEFTAADLSERLRTIAGTPAGAHLQEGFCLLLPGQFPSDGFFFTLLKKKEAGHE
jgi:SAM-dependent methyltransferase